MMSMTGAYMHVSGLDRSQTYGKFMAQYVTVDHKIYFNELYSTSEMSAAWYIVYCTELTMMFDDVFVERVRTKCLLLVLIVLVFMCYLAAVQIRPSDSLLLYQL